MIADANSLIYESAAAIMIGCAVCTAVELQTTTAPYGRYAEPPVKNNDIDEDDDEKRAAPITVDARSAWVVQETPSVVAALLASGLLGTASGTKTSGGRHPNLPPANLALLSMFLIHYCYRSFVFPLRMRGGKRVPLSIVAAAGGFCAFNGWLQGGSARSVSYSRDWMSGPRFKLGCVLWAVGLGINVHSDNVLRSLRAPGETGYKIPRGGMFEYVTGANYFGEMVEWAGFALASSTWPALAFWLFTCANIGPRAMHHHKWYLERFGDAYPSERKALIPYVL